MDLVDRFASYVAWPMSRKIVLIGAVGVHFTLLAGGVNDLAHRFGDFHVMKEALIGRFVLIWAAAQILCTLAAVPAARANREARWTAYLFVVVQSGFMVALLQLFGIMSSPIVAVFPAVVIFWILCLDERLGLTGMALMTVMILAVGTLETYGVLPHAPLLLERSLDAQNNPLWFGTFLFHILVLLSFCVSLCVLFLAGRRLQARRLREARDAVSEANRLIRRYVPAQLAEQILAGDYEEASAPRRRRLTIVFVDIEGYTAAAEAIVANKLECVLNRYLSEMMTIADRHGGTVNQIVGDGLLVFFGAPSMSNDRDHALRAVRMALDMQARAQELHGLWAEQGWPRPFRLRVGINTGEASVGDFGPPGRKLYSAIGLQTNLAERIQTLCEPGQTLMHEATWALVNRDIACQPRGSMTVKGVSEPISVFEALGERGAGHEPTPVPAPATVH